MTDGWSTPGLPHKGWSWASIDDLGDLSGSCAMCGTAIRYVHIMTHPDWPDEMEAGCVCAEKMSDDYVGPSTAEKEAKKVAGQRARWLTRKWKKSRNGNSYANVDRKTLRDAGQDNPNSVNVVVFQNGAGAWRARVGQQWCAGYFISEDAAKVAAFKTLRP